MNQYRHLSAFPENRDVLRALKARGVPAGILSNGDPEMLGVAVKSAGFSGYSRTCSACMRCASYKTDPAAYALGPQALELPAKQILFVSSNGWDAIGATWYGYTTLWVNRDGAAARAARHRTDAHRHAACATCWLSFEPSKGARTMSIPLPQGMQINAPILPGFETILTPPALALVAKLHRAFEPRRQQLLAARAERAKRLDAGERPDFLRRDEARSATATGRSRRSRRRCTAAASRSPGRSTPRWSSTRSTRAPTAT